jgi:pimeloyl-ACP methyl ester carboxylesterase
MNIHSFICLTLCVVAFAFSFLANIAFAQPNAGDKPEPARGFFNLPTKTFGGMQFWSDVRCIGGWKIQRNSSTGHHRLLRPDGTRMAWGNLPHCDQELGQQVNAGVVQRESGKVVILLHGLMRASNSMSLLGDHLAAHGDYSVIDFEYASTRENIDVHAADLKAVIDRLGPGVTEINFVGHSLGNIVVRHYLGDQRNTNLGRDKRIKRMVMLGPPNQGSRMARIAKDSLLFKTITGASGRELATSWELVEPKLAIPDFEFGIIAGGQDKEEDWDNFMLKGPDDFTVALKEAKLAGAHDLLVRPLLHSNMMKQPIVLESTLRFFEDGYFLSKKERRPIPVDWKP